MPTLDCFLVMAAFVNVAMCMCYLEALLNISGIFALETRSQTHYNTNLTKRPVMVCRKKWYA